MTVAQAHQKLQNTRSSLAMAESLPASEMVPASFIADLRTQVRKDRKVYETLLLATVGVVCTSQAPSRY